MDDYQFDVFISYRREDGDRIAKQLRRSLVKAHNRVPDSRPRLKVYLDQIYARATEDFFRDEIRPSLLSSRWLLVVATPKAAKRPPSETDWLAREIEEFERKNGLGQIRILHAGGDELPELPNLIHKRMPNAQYIDLRGFQDFIPDSRARDDWLALLATLFDVPSDLMPQLRRIDTKARRKTMAIGSGVIAAIVVFSVALFGYSISQAAEAKRLLNLSYSLIGGSALSSVSSATCDTLSVLERAGADSRIRPALACHILRTDEIYLEKGEEAAISAFGTWEQYVERYRDLDVTSGERTDFAEAGFDFEFNILEYKHHAKSGKWMFSDEEPTFHLPTVVEALKLSNQSIATDAAFAVQADLLWPVLFQLENNQRIDESIGLMKQSEAALRSFLEKISEPSLLGYQERQVHLGALNRRISFALNRYKSDYQNALLAAEAAISIFESFDQTEAEDIYQAVLAYTVHASAQLKLNKSSKQSLKKALELNKDVQSLVEDGSKLKSDLIENLDYLLSLEQ